MAGRVRQVGGCVVALPQEWSLGNFEAVLNEDTTYRPMLNGFILCGGATLLTLVCSVLAAYPLSRYQSRYKRPFMLTILFTTGLPITAIMVPVYGFFVQIDLIDTFTGTILFMATTSLPIAIWLTKNFMDAVPIEGGGLTTAPPHAGAAHDRAALMAVISCCDLTFIHLWEFFVPFISAVVTTSCPRSRFTFSAYVKWSTASSGRVTTAARAAAYCAVAPPRGAFAFVVGQG